MQKMCATKYDIFSDVTKKKCAEEKSHYVFNVSWWESPIKIKELNDLVCQFITTLPTDIVDIIVTYCILEPVIEPYLVKRCNNQTVFLHGSEIASHSKDTLGYILSRNSIMTDLTLWGSDINSIGFGLLRGLELNTTLKKFKISVNTFGNIKLGEFAKELIMNSALEKLSFSPSTLRTRDACAIAEALRVNSVLKYLDLSNNKIGDGGLYAIGQSLKLNKTLQEIDLRNNIYTKRGRINLEKTTKRYRSNTTFLFGWVRTLHDGIGRRYAISLSPDEVPNFITKKVRLTDVE